MNKLVDETFTCAAKTRITREEVERAIEWAQNHIVCKESFKKRPELMSVCMFDRFTNSNAESEHCSLKKSSIGLKANGSLHQLYKLSDMDARRRHGLKSQHEHTSLTTTDVNTLCPLSTFLTKSCFHEIEQRVVWARQCVSKQLSTSTWQVVYQRKDSFDANEINSFLPYIKRIREVSKDVHGYLSCTCRCYERYGYPCHHLLHVLKCYSTHNVQREWIHIRWSKVYIRYHYSTGITPSQRKTYERLYDNAPSGPKHISNLTNPVFPIYDSYQNSKIAKEIFDMPKFQIMSRSRLNQPWIYAHNTSDSELKKLLTYTNDSLYDAVLFSSQMNTKFSQPIEDDNADDFQLHMSDDNISSSSYDKSNRDTLSNNVYPEVFNYTAHNVLLKRAVDLC